jgi:hypothetical protein
MIEGQHQARPLGAAATDRGLQAKPAAKAEQFGASPFAVVKRRIPEEGSVAENPKTLSFGPFREEIAAVLFAFVVSEGMKRPVTLSFPD